MVNVLEAIFKKLFKNYDFKENDKTCQAKNIKLIRDRLGISRKEFSDSLSLSKQEEKQLKDWESGKFVIPTEIYNKIMNFPTNPPFKNKAMSECKFTQIDLFAGIGGIRLAFQDLGG